MSTTRVEARQKRHWRSRAKLHGSTERPRMSVHFSGKNIYVQFVDDTSGRTLAAASTVEKDFRNGKKNQSNVSAAKKLGEIAAKRARSAKIATVVFDRGGSKYHGRVSALADAARAAGLKF